MAPPLRTPAALAGAALVGGLFWLWLGGATSPPEIPMDIHSHARPNEVRVQHVRLDLELDFDKQEIRGTVGLRLERQDPTADLILMLLPAQLIRRSARGGVRNDGLVPVESATFRYDPIDSEYEQVLPADHAAQIGHGYGRLGFGLRGGFNHLDFYAHLANALGRRGLYLAERET